MKLILSLLLAIPLALVIICRLRRRRQDAVMHIHDRPMWSLAIRLVAIVLVFFSMPGEIHSQETKPKTSTAKTKHIISAIDESRVKLWFDRRRELERARFASSLMSLLDARGTKFKTGHAKLQRRHPAIPMQFFDLLQRAFGSDSAPKAMMTQKEVLEVFDALDKGGFYFAAFHGPLFRFVSCVEAEEREILYPRLRQHVRLSDALELALKQTKPISVSPQAWASKAGPSRHFRLAEKQIYKGVLASVRQALKIKSPLSWDRYGTTSFLIREGRVEGLSSADTIVYGPGAVISVERLSTFLVKENTEFEHAWLGAMSIKKGSVLDGFSLPNRLSEKQKDLIRKTLDQAIRGDRTALQLLELSYPFCRKVVDAALPDFSRESDGWGPIRMIQATWWHLTVSKIPVIPKQKRP